MTIDFKDPQSRKQLNPTEVTGNEILIVWREKQPSKQNSPKDLMKGEVRHFEVTYSP
jgi:hypothetical protein